MRYNRDQWRRLTAGDNQMKAKKAKTAGKKESSSEFFQNLRPKFLDWNPLTEEEKAREVTARREAKEAELKRVTELAKSLGAEKAATRKR
jgi:hypothetical protein